LSALPTWGPGRLFLRDDGKQISGDAEKKLFTTEHPGWRKTAEKMVAAGVGTDFFLAAPGGGYLDIATIGKYYCLIVQESHIPNIAQVTYLHPLAEKLFTIPTLFPHGTMKSCALKYYTPSRARLDTRHCSKSVAPTVYKSPRITEISLNTISELISSLELWTLIRLWVFYSAMTVS
jgi:hypothetical protein